MDAKIQLKNGKIGTFGGIFSILDYFNQTGLSQLIDNTLNNRDIQAKFTYSDIIKNLAAIFLCGGTAIEDANVFRNETFSRNPSYRFCSPDTILKSFAELQKNNTEIESVVGQKYNFNINENLNKLLIKSLLQCKLLDGDNELVFDYDNQFIATEKQDAKYSYKKKFGYFPGVAQINLHPFYVENRDGNAHVKLEQAETLERAFKQLSDNGIKVDKARMDCGSYAADIIEVVASNCGKFYIRANQCHALHERIESEIPENKWIDVEIDYQQCQLASLPFTAFFEERKYRLVIQRTLVTDKEATLFNSYVYRCILTNDNDGSEEETVRFYNQRGCSEQTFDVMNNDFGWRHLPCCDMSKNTVFMVFMSIIRNFYVAFLKKLSVKTEFGLRATSRVKRFIFHFVSVPFKWVRQGRQWWLQLYTQLPYDKILQ